MTVRLVFDWDPVKETAHLRKHGVRFSEAMSVFSDPFSLSKFDEEHSGAEERWITLGLGALG